MDANANNQDLTVEFSLENIELNAEYNLENENNIDADFLIYAAAVWGSISGTLSDQEDLQNALDLKADKSELESDMAAVDEAISNVQTVVENNYNTLDNKIDNVNSELSGDISTLENTVNSNNTAVNNRIDATNQTVAELSTTVADNNTAINSRVDGIVETFDSDISNLETAIQNEAATRANNDTLLQGDINTLRNDLTSEISNRTSADNTLQDNIDTLSSDLSDEVTARENADSIIGDSITALDNKFDSITGGLSDSITALDNKYDSVTGALDDKIDSINGALSDSITALDSVVSSNYTTLDGKIDSVNGALSDSIIGLDTKYDSITGALDTKIDNHIGDTLNPHSVTKAQVGLGNCDNTSDANKPISTATQNALDSISGALSNEADIRQNADNGLQSQIDAIVVSSDVFDVVGTYAELQAYDITTVPVNDIIKVLVDSTHDNAATYYRCVENNNVKSWSYIGAEGAYYTKSEADGRFVPLTRTINNKALSSNITLTASDVGALPDNTTIGDATLTIQVNSSTVDTFTANATSNKSINIQCATPSQGTKADTALQPNDNITKLTNNAGYITNSALSGYATETYVDTGLATKQDTLTEGSGISISTGGSVIPLTQTIPYTFNEVRTDVIFVSAATFDQTKERVVILEVPIDTSYVTFWMTGWGGRYGICIENVALTDIYVSDGSTYEKFNTTSFPVSGSHNYLKFVIDTDNKTDIYYGYDNSTWALLLSKTRSNQRTETWANGVNICNDETTGWSLDYLYVAYAGESGISCDNTIARVSQIPTNNNQLTNGAGYITSSALNGYATENFVTSQGYITGITSGDVTTALGYTPYNSSNPSGYQANVIETVKVNGTALTVTSKAVDVTVPTKVSDLTNDSGYTTNVGTVTKVNNTSPDSNGNVTISIPSAVTETTVSGWGFTKNTGTVTSVNNVSPVKGNVTLSIPDIEAFTAAEVQTIWNGVS